MNFLSVLLTVLVSAIAIADKLPRNCQDILTTKGRNTVKSSTYTIHPTNQKENGIQVFCDMDTSDGGWIVIQRRREAEQQPRNAFYRSWDEYARGFGSIDDSHWLGLNVISLLTNTDNYKLRVDMMDWEGQERYAEYSFFKVSDASDNYTLTVEGYSGNANDSLTYHSGMQFTTKDRDNDNIAAYNCAHEYHGGWWYNGCHYANLNGVYGALDYGMGLNWYHWHGHYYSLKRVEMKIRSNNENFQ